MKRGEFIRYSAFIAAAFIFKKWYEQRHSMPYYPIFGKFQDIDFNNGHTIRQKDIKTPSNQDAITYEVIIIGGGVSGLSAARELKKRGISFKLFELEPALGGNSASSSLGNIPAPWGAHYIPLPNTDNQPLLRFLEETGVLIGYDEQKLPIYNPSYICQAPQEQLYIHGHWQYGILPTTNLNKSDKQDFETFKSMLTVFQQAKGTDNKWVFDIPIDLASENHAYNYLDAISMEQFLNSQNLKSEKLHWYINYCCMDEFGADYTKISAFYGIFYFAARRGVASNTFKGNILTWPEGNSFLVQKLSEDILEHCRTNTLIQSILYKNKALFIDALNTQSRVITRYQAKQIIVAIPQFIFAHLFKSDNRKELVNEFNYHPWVVVQLRIDSAQVNLELAWDNVFYQSKTLGYVLSNHQTTSLKKQDIVLTCYIPLSKNDPKSERKNLLESSDKQWFNLCIQELGTIDSNLKNAIKDYQVRRWGHGMISPYTGFYTSQNRKNAAKSLFNAIHFAHSDLSGISIFEEAFYRGQLAANKSIQNLNLVY